MAWRQPKYDNQRQSNNFAGGLNTGTPAFSLEDNEATALVGFNTEENPALKVRNGRTTFGASGASVTNLLTNFANTHLVRAVGTKLQHYKSADGTWPDITGTFSDNDWGSTNFNGKLILGNGVDSTKAWDGTTLTTLANAPVARYITNDTVRVWAAAQDLISYSAFLDETDWTTAENAGTVQYYTPEGGRITALCNFGGHVCVFKRNSFAEIYGRSYYEFQLVENSNDIGCAGYKTLVEVGDTLFWLGDKDVYMYRGGSPIAIGHKIKDYLDIRNSQWEGLNWGGTDGTRYYLGLVTGSATQPNVLLVYDPRYNIWHVDNSGEVPFRYSANINGQWYVGDSNGQTWKMNDGTTDGGTAVAWHVISKAFNEGIPEAEKEYYELHIQAYLPSGSTMTVGVSTDDNNATFTTVQTIMTSSDSQNVNIIVPLDTVPLANWFRYKISGTGPATIYEVQRYFRVEPVQM